MKQKIILHQTFGIYLRRHIKKFRLASLPTIIPRVSESQQCGDSQWEGGVGAGWVEVGKGQGDGDICNSVNNKTKLNIYLYIV